jgi:hypothetical protein
MIEQDETQEAINEAMTSGAQVAQEQDTDEINNAEDAIRELGQTDFDASDESAGRMGELIKGIAFDDESEEADEFIEEMNQAVSQIALDMGIVGEEDLPDDLVSSLETAQAELRDALETLEAFLEEKDVDADELDRPLVDRQLEAYADEDTYGFIQENREAVLDHLSSDEDRNELHERLNSVRERFDDEG